MNSTFPKRPLVFSFKDTNMIYILRNQIWIGEITPEHHQLPSLLRYRLRLLFCDQATGEL